MGTIRLTAAQALVRYLAAQRTMLDGVEAPLFAGCWAIFGHGNVAGHRRGALPGARDPADLSRPQRAGHGAGGGGVRQGEEPPADDGLHHARSARAAMNMLTAAGVAHVNRLPVLFLPGDVFANRGARPGAAADRGLQRRHHGRHRLLPAGVALVGPDHPARAAADLAAARHAGADRSGRVRPGHAGHVPGRAGRGVRLPRELLRAAACAPPSAGRAPIPTSWPAWSSCCARPSGR